MATENTVLAIFDPHSSIGNRIFDCLLSGVLRQADVIRIQYPDISCQSGPGRKKVTENCDVYQTAICLVLNQVLLFS